MVVTTDELRKQINGRYQESIQLVGKLCNTHISMAGIKQLANQVEIAKSNDLAECDLLDFLLDLSHATKLTILTELYSDLQWQCIYRPKAAVKTSKMIALVELVI